MPCKEMSTPADIEQIRVTCRYNFDEFIRRFFNEHVWGEFSEMHQDIIEREKRPERRGTLEVDAAPRGNAKTVFRVLIKVIHSIVYEYHPFTVIIGYSNSEAEGKVRDIRDELLHNEELIQVYGKLLHDNAGVEGFVTKNGCMVLPRGRGGQVRGLRHGKYRPTHIICDDVEDLEACQSQTQRDKTKEWLKKDVLPAGQSGEQHRCCVTFVGTVIHEESLLADLLKDPSWRRKKYKAIKAYAEREDLWEQWRELYRNLDDEDSPQTARAFFDANETEMLKGTDVLWPANEDESYYGLQVQRLKLGDAAFNSEKQNEPYDPDRQILDPSLCPRFKVYWPSDPEWNEDDLDLPDGFVIVREDTGKAIHSNDLNIIAFHDPALAKKAVQGKSSKPDFSAIVVCAQDISGYIYVLDVWLKKLPPDKQIKAAFDLQAKWGFPTLYLETVGFQDLMKIPYKEEAAKRSNTFRIVGVGQHSNKQARISTLEPYFTNRWICLPLTGIDPEFISQLRLFPTVHDDGPDALQGCVARLRKPMGGIKVLENEHGVT